MHLVELSGSEDWTGILINFLITWQGYDVVKHGNAITAYSRLISCDCGHALNTTCSYHRRNCVLSPSIVNHPIIQGPSASAHRCRKIQLLGSSEFGRSGLHYLSHRSGLTQRSQIHATVDVAAALDVINDLGFDTLTFLAVTVMVVPTFKILRASPVSIVFTLKCILTRKRKSIRICFRGISYFIGDLIYGSSSSINSMLFVCRYLVSSLQGLSSISLA